MQGSFLSRTTLLLCALFTVGVARSQTFSITQPSINTCTGALLDSGGEGGTGYQDNENFTTIICPDQPGLAISLNFVIFNLSSAAPVPLDQITIYDGPSTSDPVIGTYSALNPAGIISASFANTSGCLTVNFQSNSNGVGVFAATISCFEPCQPPTAVGSMSEPAPALICQGEPVSFDGSASFAAAGYQVVQYIWNFDDGSVDSTSGPSVSHTFPAPPGEYVVGLSVIDDNGCVNTNAVELQVLVSTTPVLTGFANQTVCLGESVELSSTATPVTWTGVPNADFGAGIPLPDELGIPFISQLSFNQFGPGQTLTNIDQLESICIDMEHSFMGDFVLQLSSPTGQTVIFHQQGGGGTYLGIPVDDENQPDVPGTCWTYCFSPTATNGTWVDNSGGTNLPAGTYESLQPLTGFVGSQLNGTWTLTFTDLWGIDNGFICGWTMNFDPSILPDVTVYTPVIDVTDPDSVYWSGADLTLDPNNPLHASVTPTAPGTDTYTFSVVDNFGCTYDTTLNITTTPSAIPTITSAPACNEPTQLGVTLTPPLPFGTLIYTWSPSTGLSNPNVPFPTADPDAPTIYELHVYPLGHPLCGLTDTVLVDPYTWLQNDSSIVQPLCFADGTGQIQIITTGNGGPWDYTWTDADGNVVRSTSGAIGDIYQGSGGVYQVRVEETSNGSGCVDSLSAEIIEPSLLQLTGISNDTTICRTGSAVLITDATGGTGAYTFNWNNGLPDSGTNTVAPLIATVYTVFATDDNGCVSDTLDATVNVNAPLSFTLSDTVETCPHTDLPLAIMDAAGGDGAFRYDWGDGAQPLPVDTVNTLYSQQLCVVLTDGCETPAVTHCMWIAVTPLPPLVLTADSVLGCDPFAVRFTVQDTTGGATVDWDFGDGVSVPGPPAYVGHTYGNPGHFDVSVAVHWPNGCIDTTTAHGLIVVEPVPDADFLWSPNPGNVYTPTLHFTDASGPFATSWYWDLAGMDTAWSQNPSYTFPSEVGGSYPVTLVAANYLGCTDTARSVVEITDEFLVFVPNAFTPDGNGINEGFGIIGRDIDVRDFDFMIFDRWGELMFETTDRGHLWDGTYNGTLVKEGVYAWKLRARSAYSGEKFEQVGHVSVLR